LGPEVIFGQVQRRLLLRIQTTVRRKKNADSNARNE
jgi:hypothetical protein